ncbi:MAG: DUF2911 domain-containing protein [Arachidicoccus sp.]|nr:DUF2911 domain-containing protein [Arachidicoccus sp.]
MKKIIAFSVLCVAFAASSFAQHVNKLSPPDSVENNLVSIKYAQPSIRGRKIFGNDTTFLVPFGKVWRTGADSATHLLVKKDIMFGGKLLKTGYYSLFTIPNENEWTIIVNGEPKQWGAYTYEKNKDKDVLSVKAKATTLPSSQEKFSISLEGNYIVLRWDTTEVKIKIKKA